MVPSGNSRNSVLRALLSGHPLNPDALAFLEITIALQLVDMRTNDFQIASF
jgi:hypothetical protein